MPVIEGENYHSGIEERLKHPSLNGVETVLGKLGVGGSNQEVKTGIAGDLQSDPGSQGGSCSGYDYYVGRIQQVDQPSRTGYRNALWDRIRDPKTSEDVRAILRRALDNI